MGENTSLLMDLGLLNYTSFTKT